MELACVFDRTEQQIVSGLTEVYRRRDFRFYEVPLAPGHGWESEQSNDALMLSAPSAVGTCILFEQFCEDLDETSEQLSAVLEASVLAAQQYEAYWGYDLFVGGKRVDSFLTDPPGYYQAQFFKNLPPEDAPKYVGRPELIARARPGLNVADIERYVIPWTDELTCPPRTGPRPV